MNFVLVFLLGLTALAAAAWSAVMALALMIGAGFASHSLAESRKGTPMAVVCGFGCFGFAYALWWPIAIAGGLILLLTFAERRFNYV